MSENIQKNENLVFEKIAHRLQRVLPAGWNKICMYAEISEKSYEISYYCFVNGKSKPIHCYALVDEYQIEEKDIDEVFADINQLLKPFWKQSNESGKEAWSNFTLVFESTGKFSGYYDYTDLSEGSYNYKKVWKDKYLL